MQVDVGKRFEVFDFLLFNMEHCAAFGEQRLHLAHYIVVCHHRIEACHEVPVLMQLHS